MIKVKIVDDFATDEKCIFIYHEDKHGKKHFAKPVNIVISEDEHEGGSIAEPTIRINGGAFVVAVENDVPTPTKEMLKQKETDKNNHVKSLEKIIESLIR